MPISGSGGGYVSFFSATSTESSNFIARTSGLSDANKNYYDALITGLVADNVWATLDALYVYATPDSATSLLNLVSSSFPCVTNGSPTFTPNVGYAGVDASITVYLNTQFNPSTASSPKHIRDSAHLSAWSNTDSAATASGGVIIGVDQSGVGHSLVIPRFSDNISYFRLQASNATSAVGNGQGHFISNRSASNLTTGYRNGSSVGTDATASSVVQNANIYVLGFDSAGPSFGFGGQCCSASIGGSLDATKAAALYNRLRTYMTAVGVP